MQYHRNTLSNGLTTLIIPMASTQTVTMLATIKAGSRNEDPKEQGLAHFSEHVVFKGGKNYQTSQEIAGAVDSVGGDLNAYTTEESTTYYVKVAKEFIDLGLDILTDLVVYPRFPQKEIKKEAGVIIEEINMYEDMPKSKAHTELAKIIYQNHSLGWSIAGTKQTVKNLSRKNFTQFHQKFYNGANTTITIAGAVKPQDDKKIKIRFQALNKGEKSQTEKPLINQNKPIFKQIIRPSEQTHLAFGLRALPISDPRRFVYRMLAIILGGSMSSRLFVNVREKQGLCYYINTSTQAFTDTGHLNISCGVDNGRVNIAIESILRELIKVKEKGVSNQELEKAKQLMIGRMKLSLEDSEQVAEFFGHQQTLENQVQTPEEIFKKIQTVKSAEIKALAKEIFENKNLNLSIVGPRQNTEQMTNILHF